MRSVIYFRPEDGIREHRLFFSLQLSQDVLNLGFNFWGCSSVG